MGGSGDGRAVPCGGGDGGGGGVSDNPLQMPEWQALARECKLVRQLLGSGVTALGKANYADGKGNYYLGFFGVSVGLERLAKLILVAEYSIKNTGSLPDEKVIRKFGHNIKALLNEVGRVEKANSLSIEYKKPADSISESVIECLDSFADAQKGRYANFASLGDPDLKDQFEPIRRWWKDVADPILKAHFDGTARAKRVESNARIIGELLGSYSSVLHIGEDGSVIDNVQSASLRTGQTELVQTYGRFYTLRIARWMSDVFYELTHYGCYSKNVACLFGHYEHFNTFRVGDSFLKSRKVWPL
jgi:hypothetical protein